MNKEQLKLLLEMPGISGREEKVAEYVEKQLVSFGFEIDRDNMGSVWGIKKSNNPEAQTILIDAHMDEVGFITTELMSNGMIKFEEIGGISKETMNSNRLRVWNQDLTKSYGGTVLFNKTSPYDESTKTPDIVDMYLDLGFTSKEELIELGIKEGSSITFDSTTEFTDKRVIGKAVDNRVGVSMVLEIAKSISEKEFDFNIAIGVSTQEEVGLRGARTFAYKVKPDLAIVIDVSPASDIPSGETPYGMLGKGTMIRHKDRMTITPARIIEYLRSLVKENDIKHQDYISLGATNAGVIHIWEEGRPVIPLGIVARGLHTGSTVFDIEDYEATLKLAELILSDLSSDKIVKFK